MPEPLSFEDDTKEAILTAEILHEDHQRGHNMTVAEADRHARSFNDPWPISGDHLTKAGLK